MEKSHIKPDSNHKTYRCKYCGKIMSSFDYDTFKGYCGNCRNILDWKKILTDVKEFKE